MNTKSSLIKITCRNRFVICLLFTILYIQMLNNSTIYAKSFYESVTDYESTADRENATDYEELQKSYFNDLEITSPSAVVIDVDTGMVVFNKNKDEKNYPASITKIMTALLTLEKYGGNLDERISFSHEAVFSLPYGSSHIAMNDGETLTVEQAMNGLMLASANDVANALAEDIGGTMENFANMMTERARSLSALNTSFANAHGLHDENHYTTAYDMALIMREAIKNDDFVRYISTRRYDIPPTEKQKNSRQLVNTNKLIQPGEYLYEYAVGGKTGFTNESMHTLVTYAKKDGVSLIAAVMHDEKNATYTDTIAMMDAVFDSYKSINIADLSRNITVPGTISAVQEYEGNEYETGTVDYSAGGSAEILLPSFITADNVKIEKITEEKLIAPVKQGDRVGYMEFKYDGSTIGKIDLLADNDVELLPESELKNEIADEKEQNMIEDILRYLRFILIFSCCFFALVVILLVFLIRRRNMRRRRRKNARVNAYRPTLTKMYK